jgi:hypothetical protein
MSTSVESIESLTATITELQDLIEENASALKSILTPKVDNLKARLQSLGKLENTDLSMLKDPIIRVLELPPAVQASIYQLRAFRFLNLPAEVRNHIYRFYFNTNLPVSKNPRFDIKDGKIRRAGSYSLLFANKQIYTESRDFIYPFSELYFEAAFGVPHLPPFELALPDFAQYPSFAAETTQVKIRTGTDHRRVAVNQQVLNILNDFKKLEKISVKITIQYCHRHELSMLLAFFDTGSGAVSARPEFHFVFDSSLRPLRTQGSIRLSQDPTSDEIEREKKLWEDEWQEILEDDGHSVAEVSKDNYETAQWLTEPIVPNYVDNERPKYP